MIDLNTFLSIVNGAWTIMLAVFVVFLMNHLWETRGTDSEGRAVAVAILIADVGNWIVRGSVWVWREVGAPTPLPDWLIGLIGFGALVGTIGMLCKLRVFSIARFGHAPWVACAVAVLVFIVVKLI